LKEEELELINSARYEVHFNPGETIFKQGGPSTHALSFTNGLAKIHIEGEGRNNVIVNFVKPVEFIAGPGLFLENKHHFSITAIESSSVCVIDNQVFRQVIKQNNEFAEAYFKMLSKKYVSALFKLSNHIRKQSKGITAESILFLSHEIYNANPFYLSITINELSEYCGISKESISKTLKEFANDGIIQINRRKIEILKPDLLKQISIKG